MAIHVKEPSVVRVSYISGHNLFRGKYPNVVLRTEDGAVVAPTDVETWAVEARRTTKYYVLAPGQYRLFEHRHPVIKTLRDDEPRPLVGDRVVSELDAKTDANDDRGRTTESWRIPDQLGREYFVLVHGHAPDNSDDFEVEVAGTDEETHDVGDARWLGPLVGAATIRVSTWGTTAWRYGLRVARQEDGPFPVRTAAVGAYIDGRLGPGTSNLDSVGTTFSRDGILVDRRGWVDKLTFTNEHEQQLFVVVGWMPDVEALEPPAIQFLDDAGHRIELDTMHRRRNGIYIATGVFATRKPLQGAMHVNIQAEASDLTSGRYSVCVAAVAKFCDRAIAEEHRLRSP